MRNNERYLAFSPAVSQAFLEDTGSWGQFYQDHRLVCRAHAQQQCVMCALAGVTHTAVCVQMYVYNTFAGVYPDL